MHASGNAKKHGKQKLILTIKAAGTHPGRFRFGPTDPSKVFLMGCSDYEPGRIENLFSMVYGSSVPVTSQWKKLLGSVFLQQNQDHTGNRPSKHAKNAQTFTCVCIMRAYTLYTKTVSIKSLKPILLGYWDDSAQPTELHRVTPIPVKKLLGFYWDFRPHRAVVYRGAPTFTTRLTYLQNL